MSFNVFSEHYEDDVAAIVKALSEAEKSKKEEAFLSIDLKLPEEESIDDEDRRYFSRHHGSNYAIKEFCRSPDRYINQLLIYRVDKRKFDEAYDNWPMKWMWEVVDIKEDGLKVRKYDGKDYLKKEKVITPQQARDMLEEVSFGLFKEGRIVISREGAYGRIVKMSISEVWDRETSGNVRRNPHSLEIKMDDVFVEIEYEDEIGRIDLRDEKTWKFPRKERCHYKEIGDKWLIIESVQKYADVMDEVRESKTLSGRKDVLQLSEHQEMSNALVSFNTKDYLNKVSKDLQVKAVEAGAIKRGVERAVTIGTRKIEIELAEKKREMNIALAQLNGAIALFKRQIEKIRVFITTIEIYYGIYEKITQIGSGEPAALEDPICLRQQILYMDEEFAYDEESGMDPRTLMSESITFETIEKFDEYLISGGKIDSLLPERKGVLLMKPRRHSKRYIGDRKRYIHDMTGHDDENTYTYVLVRNGGNVYRIWTPHIHGIDRLFPRRDQLGALVMELAELENKKNDYDDASSHSEYHMRKIEEEMSGVEKKIFVYKKNILMLQGIILRTDIFKPLPDGLDLLKPDTYGDHVRFIYDDEMALPAGKLPYKEWLRGVNSSIVKGSRIYFIGPSGNSNDWKDRFTMYWRFDTSSPDMPLRGVFQVKENEEEVRIYEEGLIDPEEYKKNKKKYKLLSKDYVYEEQDEQRINRKLKVAMLDEKGQRKYTIDYDAKLRISFKPDNGSPIMYSFIIKPEHDEFLINYDALLLDDLEHYIHSRVDREHYYDILPVLCGLKKNLIKEMRDEEEFAKMIVSEVWSQYSQQLKSMQKLEDVVKGAIKWWKEEKPTVWKRPVASDDVKARKMIKERVLSVIRNKFKIKVKYIYDNTKKVMLYENGVASIYVFGITKTEFIDKMLEMKKKTRSLYYKDTFIKADMIRRIRIIEDTSNPMHSAATSKPKEVLYEGISGVGEW